MLRRTHWRSLAARCCGGVHRSPCSRGAGALRRLRGCTGTAALPWPSAVSACGPALGTAHRAPVRWGSDVADSPTRHSSDATNALRFEAPLEMSHRCLAYAHCPVCGQVHFMRTMLEHLTRMHPEVDHIHCARLCTARLALYERIMGFPLDLETSGAKPSATTSTVGAPPKLPLAEVTTADIAPLVKSADPVVAMRPFLPTVSPDGTYTCNWCETRRQSFPTRDAFLQHLAMAHPLVDFDVAESLTPQASAKSATAASTGKTAKGTAEATASPSAAIEYPTQRLPGVRTVVESNEVPISSQVAVRSVSIARGALGVRDVAALKSLEAASELTFGEHHFPCELCRRVFASELDLLRHLESKHAPAAPATAKAEKNSNSNSSSSSRGSGSGSVSPCPTPPAPAAPGATPGVPPSSSIVLTCDLCTRCDKVYHSASALFSHIRFRHPHEDASFETERIIGQIQQRRVFACDMCQAKFPDQRLLDRHLKREHNVNPTARAYRNIEETFSGMKPRDPEPDTKTAAPAVAPTLSGVRSALGPPKAREQFWCHHCDRGFPSAMGLYNHYRAKHDRGNVYPCPACKRIFQDMPTLGQHLRARHHNTSLEDLGLRVSVTCPDCPRELIDYEALHLHAVRHHGKSPLSPIVTFVTPATPTTPGETTAPAQPGTGEPHPAAAAPEGEGAPTAEAAEAPSKPRKVTRRKKATAS